MVESAHAASRPSHCGPKPPIPPILPRSQACFVQNKPNCLKDKNTATPCSAKTYEDKPPQPPAKKQTQSNPIPPRRERTQNLGTKWKSRSIGPGTKWKSRSIGGGKAETGARPRRTPGMHIGIRNTKNKPNFQNPKTTATFGTTSSYTNIPPRRTRKNKPNQTQFFHSHQYPKPPFLPKLSPQSAHSDTRHTTLSAVPIHRGYTSGYDIRNATSDIRARYCSPASKTRTVFLPACLAL